MKFPDDLLSGEQVAKVRQAALRSKEVRVESMWARAMERADRPWIVLLCCMSFAALAMLLVVAHRLQLIVEGGQLL